MADDSFFNSIFNMDDDTLEPEIEGNEQSALNFDIGSSSRLVNHSSEVFPVMELFQQDTDVIPDSIHVPIDSTTGPVPCSHFNLENRHFSAKTAGVHASNPRQGMQLVQRNSDPTSTYPIANNNSVPCFDAPRLSKPSQSSRATSSITRQFEERQCRVNGQTRNVKFPGQSSLIVPLPHDNQADYRQLVYEMQIASVEEKKSQVLKKIYFSLSQVGLNGNMSRFDINTPLDEYRELCAEKVKIEMRYEKRPELEPKQRKRIVERRISAWASQERKVAVIPPLRDIVEFLITDKIELHAEIRRLRDQLSGLSPTGQPPGDPPSEDPPPKDFGQDDPAPDGSNPGRPRSSFPSSNGGPAFGSNPSSKGPSASSANARLPTGTSEDHDVSSSDEGSSSEESDIDEQNISELNLVTQTIDYLSFEDSDDDASREHEVRESLLTESETADRRSMNEESGQKISPCTANEPGRSERHNQILTPENNLHELKSQTPTSNMKREVLRPGSSSRRSEKKKTLEVSDSIPEMPMLAMPQSSSISRRLRCNGGNTSGNDLRQHKCRTLKKIGPVKDPDHDIPVLELSGSAFHKSASRHHYSGTPSLSTLNRAMKRK